MRRVALTMAMVVVLLPGSACRAQAQGDAPGRSNASRVKMETVTEIFDDFEKPNPSRYWRVGEGARWALVNVGVTGGGQALQVTFRDAKSTLRYRRTGLDGYGSGYSRSLEVLGARFIFNNAFSFDVLNPGEKSRRLVVTFGSQPFTFTVKPGANTISIPTEEIAAGVYRMTQAGENVVFSVPDAAGSVLIFDRMRLEREGVGRAMKRHARCFDFGPADMCRPGFTPVDSKLSYESRRGYGWVLPNTEEEKGKLRTVISSGAMPLGDLIRDGVMDLSSPFVVDCPNGKYRVHLVGGYHWGGIYHLMPVDYDFTIKAEGAVKYIRLRASDQAERIRRIYGHDQTRYAFSEDLWRRFGRPVYGPIVFDVDVTDGQLNLEFLTSPQPDKGFLNFLVVYPASHAGEVAPELGRVWDDVRRRYNRVSFRPLHPKLAVELKKPDLHEEYLSLQRRIEKISVLAALPEYSGRDFMIYARDHFDQVYPDTVPDPEEKTTRLQAVGAPGEIVPVTFSIFALHKVETVRVDLSELEGPLERRVLPGEIDLRMVRYSRRMLAQRHKGDWQYMVVPWYLVNFRTLDVDRYMSRRFWLNVHLAADLLPGKYAGTVRVRTRRSGQVLLRLEIEVLPFRLRRPDTGRFRTVYFVQPFNNGNEPYGQTVRAQKTFRLPASHARQVEKVFERLHRREVRASLETLGAYGFDTVYAGDWLTDMSEANRMLLEPLAFIQLQEAIRSAKRRAPAKGDLEGPVYVDRTRKLAYLSGLGTFTGKTVAVLKKEKLKVILGRPRGWMSVMDDVGVARFVTGVYQWRCGADGVVVGPVRNSWGDPYHPLDGYGGERGSLLMPASRNWPQINTSRILEEMREGINDYRYLITLEHLIHEAGEGDEVKHARRFLAGVRRDTAGTLSEYVEPSGRDTWRSKVDTAWKAERYNRLRREIITHILALQESLAEPDIPEFEFPDWP